MHSRKSIIQYRHTLSQRESYVLSKLSYEEKKVFTVEDVKASVCVLLLRFSLSISSNLGMFILLIPLFSLSRESV
jgi:hypothetical protein